MEKLFLFLENGIVKSYLIKIREITKGIPGGPVLAGIAATVLHLGCWACACSILIPYVFLVQAITGMDMLNAIMVVFVILAFELDTKLFKFIGHLMSGKGKNPADILKVHANLKKIFEIMIGIFIGFTGTLILWYVIADNIKWAKTGFAGLTSIMTIPSTAMMDAIILMMFMVFVVPSLECN